MIKPDNNNWINLKNTIAKQKRIVRELNNLVGNAKKHENDSDISGQFNSLKEQLKKQNDETLRLVHFISLNQPLNKKKGDLYYVKEDIPEKGKTDDKPKKEYEITDLDRQIIKRILKRKKEVSREVEKRPSAYANISSKVFGDVARKAVEKKRYREIVADNIIKTDLEFIPAVYISMIFFTTFLVGIVSFLAFFFFLFFNISPTPPLIAPVEDLGLRFLSTVWILIVVPGGTFIFMFFYPLMERKTLENAIEQELPFATISMSAIAGSMIEPTNIFRIIVSTGEYKNLKRQFTKIINEIHIYGYDLVTALKNVSRTCPSQKLMDLYNGLSTNITSGGELAGFFSKRSETLLLDYKLQREADTRTAETFIDIYISVVIAAPMILMLLLMMIQISGLGLAMSPTMISLIMVFSIAVVNVIFFIFLHLKQPKQ